MTSAIAVLGAKSLKSAQIGQKWLTSAIALFLASCASTPAPLPPPEPVIRTVTVDRPIPVPCVAGVPDEPAFPDSDMALHAASDIFAGTKLLLAGRIERSDYIGKLRATLQGCVETKP